LTSRDEGWPFPYAESSGILVELHTAKLRGFVFIVALYPLGCGDKGSDLAETSSELWCGGLCTAQGRCGDVRTAETCRSDCVSGRPGLINISQGGAAAEKPCIGDLTCQALGDAAEWKTALDACWQQAKVSVEVTPHVRTFCADYAEAWFECSFWLSTEQCERDYAMWAAPVVDRVALCMAQPTCDAFDACVTALFKTL
jgi:hypothetical protein